MATHPEAEGTATYWEAKRREGDWLLVEALLVRHRQWAVRGQGRLLAEQRLEAKAVSAAFVTIAWLARIRTVRDVSALRG
jgi:hypothetical protein